MKKNHKSTFLIEISVKLENSHHFSYFSDTAVKLLECSTSLFKILGKLILPELVIGIVTIKC